MVKVPIQPPSPLITLSRNLEGYQSFPVSPNRVSKKHLATLNPPNPPDTPVVISKIPAKTPLAPSNPPYTLEIPSKILAEKLLVSSNILESLVPSNNVLEPPINPSRVLETPLVPLIYLNIITEGDLEPQRLTP